MENNFPRERRCVEAITMKNHSMALLCLCGKHDFLWNAFKLDFFKLSRHISHSLYATSIQMKRTYMSLNLRLILYIYTAQTCIHPHHINIFFHFVLIQFDSFRKNIHVEQVMRNILFLMAQFLCSGKMYLRWFIYHFLNVID